MPMSPGFIQRRFDEPISCGSVEFECDLRSVSAQGGADTTTHLNARPLYVFTEAERFPQRL